MAINIFKSFVSTITLFIPRAMRSPLRLLHDPGTGAPTGLQTINAGGPDGIWTPVDLTAAQIASPTSLMIADLNATYRLNVVPYTRYYSTGSGLVAIGGGASVISAGPFIIIIF